MNNLKLRVCLLPSLALIALPAFAQGVRVELSKSSRSIPRECKLVVPAAIEPQVDTEALVKEASCKGAGEMLTEFTYNMDYTSRDVDKKGNAKTESGSYEVFLPTLRAGTRARGILIQTVRNGTPVPQRKLEDERKKAGERLEKEEARIDREAPPATQQNGHAEAMTPIGMYSRTSVGANPVALAFTIRTFLKTCDFTFVRREMVEGRPSLIFKFAPRASASFDEGEGYIAQLTGEIAIDAQDHIVSKLSAWPNGVAQTAAPAVSQIMTRLKDGTWLPHTYQVNAATYPNLSEKVTRDWSSTFSHFVRFSTEVQDVKVGDPPN